MTWRALSISPYLAVARSAEVVGVANEWMARVDAAGGTVVTTR